MKGCQTKEGMEADVCQEGVLRNRVCTAAARMDSRLRGNDKWGTGVSYGDACRIGGRDSVIPAQAGIQERGK